MKKNPKDYDTLTKEFYQVTAEKGINQNFAHYVWDVLIAMSKGYGFNQSHTLAYSLIALQEMNLAYKYPIMFWNTACLISDAGGNENESEEEENIEEEIEYSSEMEDFTDEDDKEEEDEEEKEEETKDIKRKKKTKVTNYGKIASAIGKIKSTGVQITPPDINESTFTFSPDIENNAIRYGLSGITRIGEDLVKTIMAGRPYSSLKDFLARVKVNKVQMINLIKSGAFDCFGQRESIMHEYINQISDCKKRITLQNMKMLIDFKLIPDEYEMQCKVFNFNKYLKKLKNGDFYEMDNIAFNFYSNNFDIDLLDQSDSESGFKIKQTKWDKIYKTQQDIIRPYIQKNNEDLLNVVNHKLTKEVWEKYCLGSISKWEMDSTSCYVHAHELVKVDINKYGLENFYDLSEAPEIERYIPIKGKMIPILKLHRIVGTVLDRDKSKKTVTLLTTDGVVLVKIFGGVFQEYDRQLSEVGIDGKKHVIRKSEFSRGNKIIVTGVRDGDSFRAKKYARTPWHLIETISDIDGENIIINNRNDE